MEGYRFRNKNGDAVDQTAPLAVEDTGARGLTAVSETLTYNGKAAAGAVTTVALAKHPVHSVNGDRVASYWGERANLVYEAHFDGTKEALEAGVWLRSVTETATSAVFTVYDPKRNLEEMFESATGTVKRFVAKVTDNDGGTLYGWIMGVSVSASVYTFTVHNHRLTETQSWVGTLSAFDNTSLKKVEIFRYDSSLAFGTGTTLTEEVACPREYSKGRMAAIECAEQLSNGQFFVDYMRGEIVGVRADTTASETVTYNVAAPVGGGGAATIADGASVTLGAKADAKSTATDTTAVTIMSVLKQISASVQAPPTHTVNISASTTGGATMYKNIDVDESEDEVKGSAGQLFMIHAMNMKAAVLYLKVYNNTAAGVTVGTTVPDWTFPVPTLATTNGAGFTVAFPTGAACGTGITIACTTGLADNDTGAPGANEMVVNLLYK